jgi:membrane protease YdiL (CAAX protease family)
MGFAMKKDFGFILLIAVITGVIILQVLFLVEELSSYFLNTYAETIRYLSYILDATMYLIWAILIWIEIEHLEEFNIDKFTIISFILGSLFRRRLGVYGEEYFLIFIGLAGISTVVAWVGKKPKIPRTNIRWAIAGIVIASVVLIPISLLEFFLRPDWHMAPLFKDNLVLTATREINYQFSFAAILEEFLFRGFLWGYLKRKGWKESKIFWAQGILFWLLHFSKLLVTPFTFFLILPVTTYISSKLTMHSKQIYPAFLSHAVINAVCSMLNLATY